MKRFRLSKESNNINPVKAKKIRERLDDEFTTSAVKEISSIYCLRGSSVKAYIAWLIKFRMIERVGVGQYRKVGRYRSHRD